MKTSVLLFIFFAIIFFIAPSKAQSIRMIQADTIFKGYDSGVTSSVKIVNHGTSIIYNHDGKLYEMSALTYKPVREIVLDELNPVTKYDVDDNCKYIFYNTKLDTVTFVADFYTGKTIKTFRGRYFITKDFLFLRTNTQGIFSSVNARFDILSIKDFRKLDGFQITRNGDDMGYLGVGAFVCMYDKNYLIFEISHTNMRTGGNRTGTEWVAIDSATHTLKSTPFSAEGKLITTKNCKYQAFAVSGSINVYDSVFKLICNLNEVNIKKYYNDADFDLLTDINLYNDRYLISSIKYNNGTKIVQNVQVYDILEKEAIKYIDFENYTSACYNDKFILSNKAGCFVTLTLEQVPVVEENKSCDGFNVSYSNNNLILQAEKSESVDISIMNITGEVVESQNDIYVSESLNTIQLNNPLANGLYFCIIKTTESVSSHKFMVIK